MNGIEKARLVEIENFTKGQSPEPIPTKANGKGYVQVQFNPQTLKLSFSNKNAGGDQPGGSGKQFVGSGTSTMSVELLFDTSEETSDASRDVRKMTELVAYFVMAKDPKKGAKNKRTPPRVRFEWGSFIFEGVIDSMDETLEYFSENGIPLRATISLRLSRDDIAFAFGNPGQADSGSAAGGAGAPGTKPMTTARDGDSVQKMAGRDGRSGDWKSIAAANNIDDPLRLQAGALLNMNVGVGLSFGASASAGIGVNASASAELKAR
jgi:hypothetical protein